MDSAPWSLSVPTFALKKNELGRTRNADGRRENTQKNIGMEANREEN
jgi:hypothetical protein